MAYSYTELQKKKQEYEAALSQKPKDYTDSYSEIKAALLDKIASREDFSYDPYSDPLYDHYKNLYKTEGERAMKDTLASASTLTGGNLNSFAVTAAKANYDDSLSNLGDIIPDLYEAAYKRYKGEIEKDEGLYALYEKLSQSERAANEDEWDRYYKELSMLSSAYKTAEDSYYDAVKSSSSTTVTPSPGQGNKDSRNAFKDAVMSKSEFMKSANSRYYSSYSEYIGSYLNLWLASGKITAADREILRKEYGI